MQDAVGTILTIITHLCCRGRLYAKTVYSGCADKEICNPQTKSCYGDDVIDDKSGCRSGEAYERSREFCQRTVHRLSSGMQCCGIEQLYNTDTPFCCANRDGRKPEGVPVAIISYTTSQCYNGVVNAAVEYVMEQQHIIHLFSCAAMNKLGFCLLW